MVEKRIHFVCRGNTFRSRLAEGYAKSLKLDGYRFTSSGIESERKDSVILSPYARDIARREHFTAFMAKQKHQTTAAQLKRQDIIVFLSKDVSDEVTHVIDFDARRATVWNIDDLAGTLLKHPRAARTHANYVKLTNRIAERIFTKVDELVREMESTSWSDIYNEQNQPLGYRLPVGWTTERKGLWRRSVHAVITTANKKYVVEKRADRIVFAPGMLDISMGGGVDAGETPRQAVIREIKEELGLRVRTDQITFLNTQKWSRFHPHYNKYSSTFLYAYHVHLTADDPIFMIDDDEVRDVRLLSGRQINRLVRKHRLKNIGRLNYGYKYYADVVKRAKMYVK
jgi:8-oxo-dGTP pyrophosphatase MutT (NUDIX family)/protein-tyrosine-phosphatase